MSTPVCVNEGELDQLAVLKAEVSYRMRLFQNDYTPVVGSVLADFTVATFSGYSEVTLSYGSITTNGSGQGSMTASAATFTHNGGATSNTIYGFYIVNNATSKVVKAERFDSSQVMANNGDEIIVTDTMLLAGTIT